MILVQRPRHGDDALVVANVRDVVKGETDRAQRLGRTGVDALDAGVRIGAGDEAGVQHARQPDVAHERCLAGHLTDSVFALRDLADYVELVLFHRLSPSRWLIIRR